MWVKTFDDVVPLPQSFTHILMWFIGGTLVPEAGINMQQQDLNWYKLLKDELDMLKKADNLMPKEFKFVDPHQTSYNVF